jgi:uncharacterized membrane protein YhaH (DUF805 family)
MTFADSLGFLFGLKHRVDQKRYAIVGFSLLVLKYGGDFGLSLFASQRIDPISYLNPVLTLRLQSMGQYPDWLPFLMFAWSLPFIWIGVSMTARRAMDAGYAPWFALLFFLPVINNLLMLGLCLARSKEHGWTTQIDVARAKLNLRVALIALAGSSTFGIAASVFAIFGASSYSSALFVGAPFLMGVIAGALLNRHGATTISNSIFVAVLGVSLCGGLLLLFALEGVICLGMASFIAYPLAALGALLGRALAAGTRPQQPTFGMMALWPLLALAPLAQTEDFPVHAVTSRIEIDAPPESVWPNVIGFTELPPPSEWLMKAGIACPLRARIEGEGVGAIRYCEFSTGPFIEPISVWEPPYRLGFDVTSQPPSMREWSPYEIVHAPHLVGTMQSEHGEFKLTRLEGNRTLLEGTTWYRLKMSPEPYWTFYSDQVVHVIHDRVLQHVRQLSEAATKR